MKRSIFILMLICFCLVGGAFGQSSDDVRSHKECRHCGMDRGMFNFSRMLIEYEDGTAVPTCSLHCGAIDLANNIDKTPKAIMVGDYGTKELIDAEKAYWVVGGSKPGVMSRRGKWAFGKKEDADAFLAANGGKQATFDDAIKAAYEDMYEDTKMIRDKRKAKKSMEKKHQH